MRSAKYLWLGGLLIASAAAEAQDFNHLEKLVTDFTLPNGLRLIVLERHQSPLISFHTYVHAGSIDEPAGQSGLTRVLEHMFFKGTESIGSRNWPEEKKALEAMDDAYNRMEAERNKGPRRNQEQYDTLRTRWKLAVDAARRQGQPLDYGGMLTENGATGMTAACNWDSMHTAYTLPSNRLELFFLMESQRLMHPVFRDFYQERDDLIEEQQKNQNKLLPRVMELLLATAFAAHPYRVPKLGWPGDLAHVDRAEAVAFQQKYFVPGNTVIAMAGDASPAEVKRLAEKYFGPMPVRPMPSRVETVEPPQPGPRTAVLEMQPQHVGVVAYKRPSYLDKDDPVLDVIQSILVSKNGMAYRELVQEKRVAADVRGGATFPDGRYPNLFVFFLTPASGHTVDEDQRALEDVLFRLKTQKVAADVLNQARTEVRASAYRRLTENATIAEMLAIYTGGFGDWKKLFSTIEDIGKVTEDDIIRAAQRCFTSMNRTTVYTAMPAPVPPPKTGGAQ